MEGADAGKISTYLGKEIFTPDVSSDPTLITEL